MKIGIIILCTNGYFPLGIRFAKSWFIGDLVGGQHYADQRYMKVGTTSKFRKFTDLQRY